MMDRMMIAALAVVAAAMGTPASAQTLGISNCSLATSVAGNAATFAIKDGSGNDPSPSSPCTAIMRSGVAGSGTPIQRQITAAQSITIPAGATLGTVSNLPSRVWAEIFDDGANGVLAVSVRSQPGQGIAPLSPAALASTTIVSGTSNALATFYSSEALANAPYAILGYAEWQYGLVTAGQWAVPPTFVQTMAPSVPLPGQYTGNMQQFLTASYTPDSRTSFEPTVLTATITPTNGANYIEIEWSGSLFIAAANAWAEVGVLRGGTLVGVPSSAYYTSGSGESFPTAGKRYDAPGSTGPVNYVIGMKSINGATIYFPHPGGLLEGSGAIYLREVQG